MSITQHRFNKKDIFIDNDNSQVLDIFKEEGEFVNETMAINNTINDNLLVFLERITATSSALSNDISKCYNSLMDAVLLAEGGNTGISIFNNAIVDTAHNITIDNTMLSIYLAKKLKTLAVISNIKYSSSGKIGNSVATTYITNANIDSITSKTPVEFESIDTSLQVNLLFNYAYPTPINGIKFKLKNTSSSLPQIKKISVINDTGEIIEIDTITRLNPDLLTEDVYGTDVFIHIPVTNALGISIALEQQQQDLTNGTDRYSVGISEFESGFYEAVTSGYCILGPYNQDSAILKIAYSANKLNSGDAVISFSNDKIKWYDLSNTLSVSENKILNINNISADSIFFDKPAKQVWIKISLNANDISNDIFLNRRSIIEVENDLGNIIQLNPNHTFSTLYENDDLSYGEKIRTRSENVDTATKGNVEFFKDKNGYVLDRKAEDQEGTLYVYSRYDLPIVEQSTEYSITSKGGVLIEGAKLYKSTSPRTEKVQLNGKDIAVTNKKYIIKLKDALKNGEYVLKIGTQTRTIDLSLGYVLSTIATVYKVDSNDVSIITPYGIEINIPVTTIGTDKYASLLGIVFETQHIDHNTLPINNTTFYIEQGALICASGYKKQITASCISIDLAKTTIGQNTSGKKLITSDIKKGKGRTGLSEYEFKKHAKLKHCCIVKGSVKFNIDDAFINSMIREVPFIDGEKEFVSAQRKTQFNNEGLSVIELDPYFIDNETMVFYGDSSIFRSRVYTEEDLVEKGDWMILFDEINPPQIVLPEGVTTPTYADIVIEYDIDNQSISKDGIYSVDYNRGFIYCSASIDSNIIAEYQFFNMVIGGQGAREVHPSEYVANGSILTVNSVINNSVSIVYKEGNGEKEQYMESPVLSNINISTITEDYIK